MSAKMFQGAPRDGADRARAGAGRAMTASRRATTSTASRASSRRPAHKLAGQSYVGKILVLDTAKGGVATAWMLHEMKSRGIVPLALVFNSVNPILAQGAALGDVTMLAGFDEDITAAIPNGAEVEVNPAQGLLKLTKRLTQTN